MIPCPACAERFAALEEELAYLKRELRPPTPFPAAWRLPPSEEVILAQLLRHDIVSRARLMAALYGGRDDEPDSKIIDVYITRLRAILSAQLGVGLYCLMKRGWYIGAADKAIIREAMAPEAGNA
ncbi:MAG TPA: winged helix-turn-helix domain-containing protein [Caulobacterales bacterium]|nr:winged helix-turn-helix domain-containing protein [Caulobacterales bacterium]